MPTNTTGKQDREIDQADAFASSHDDAREHIDALTDIINYLDGQITQLEKRIAALNGE